MSTPETPPTHERLPSAVERMEKLWRRRMFIEGVLLAILGVLVAGSAYISDQRDTEFRTCLTDNFSDLTTSLTARSDLTEPRANSVTKLIADLLASAGDEDKGDAAVKAYEKEQKRLKDIADANPYPPFPDGTCDD